MKKGCFIFFYLFSWFTSTAENETMIGARASAIGNAGISLSDGWSAAHNPAGLGFVRNLTTGIGYENRFLLKELGTRGAVLALPVKAGTIGLSLSNFGYALYQENSYRFSAGKALSPAFSMGMSIDYLHTRLGEGYGNRSGIVATIGIQAKPLKNLVLAAHIYNPTRNKWIKSAEERIPTVMKAGMAYHFSSRVLCVVETEKNLAKKPLLKAGIEYMPLDNFYLRIGMNTNPAQSTFGIGCFIKNLQLDLAFTYHQSLGLSSQIGLSYLFTKNKKTVLETE